MPRPKKEKKETVASLLEKILVVQLYSLGASQGKIAKTVGRQKLWVNALVKDIPKQGRADGKAGKGKKR